MHSRHQNSPSQHGFILLLIEPDLPIFPLVTQHQNFLPCHSCYLFVMSNTIFTVRENFASRLDKKMPIGAEPGGS